MATEKRARSESPVKDEIINNSHENIDIDINDTTNSDVENPKSKIKLSTKKVLISNIAYEVKWQDLKSLLKDEIGEVDFVQIFESPDGRSKGVGVVEFKTEEMAQKCADKMHRFVYKGRELVVKEDKEGERDKFGEPIPKITQNDGLDFESYGIEAKTLNDLGITGPLTNRLFVANIDYKVDDRKIRDVFCLAGKVNKVWLHKGEESKPRGTGIVEMSHPVEAVQAIAMLNGHRLYNRELAIRIDKFTQDEDNKSRKFPVPKPVLLPKGLKSIGMGISIGGVPLSICQMLGGGVSPFDSEMFFDASSRGMSGSPNGLGNPNQLNSLLGSGAGYGGANNQQLMSIMNALMGTGGGSPGNNGLNPMLMSMMSQMGGGPGPMGASPGLLNSLFAGSMMDPMMSSHPPPIKRGGGSSQNSPGNVGGANKVLVKNLPSGYKWQDLKDKFREAGDIRYASVSPCKDDPSSSEGLVQFANMDSARRAVKNMDNIRLGGRVISLQLQHS
ncbi:unnamed protein product [Gordionus sp. m RMFG-2023]|uniref:myelin expression factor 2-like n=1 Tax=Gordionus sp. m RMFG-2023 TaxID=3053472 RepID=UPI0030E53E4F